MTQPQIRPATADVPQSATAGGAPSRTFKNRLATLVLSRMKVTRWFVEVLRAELNAAVVRNSYRWSPARRSRLRHLRAKKDVYLNLGCGPFPLDGFENLDLFAFSASVMPWDCRWNLPLSDGAAAGIRAEHFVEHVETREELPSLLADCWRVLRPGGVLRVIVPDAERFVRAYCAGDMSGFRQLAVPDPFPADLPTRMDVVNLTFHQSYEHRAGYDFEMLAHRLRNAGFRRVERTEFGQSLDPMLAADREVHAPYSMYVDAVK